MSGGWCLKALEHEYIDKRVLLAVDSAFVEVWSGGRVGGEWSSFLGVQEVVGRCSLRK